MMEGNTPSQWHRPWSACLSDCQFVRPSVRPSVCLSVILLTYLQERRLPLLPSFLPNRGCPSHPKQDGSEVKVPRCGLLISSRRFALRWMHQSHGGDGERERERERGTCGAAVIGFIMAIDQPSDLLTMSSIK